MRVLCTKSRQASGVYFSRGILIAALFTVAFLRLFPGSATTSSNEIDQVLREAVDEKKIPGVVAMVAVEDRVTYQGASGKRDTTKNIPMTVDSIFRIASMTKPITSVAVMQLVEGGRVKLDEAAATYLPELSQVQVLEEFDASTGRAKLRPPKTPPPSGNCCHTPLASATNFSMRSCTATWLPERFPLRFRETMAF